MWQHVDRGSRSISSKVTVCCGFFFFPETGFLASLELTKASKLTSQRAPEISLSLPGFCKWVLGMGLSLSTYKAHT